MLKKNCMGVFKSYRGWAVACDLAGILCCDPRFLHEWKVACFLCPLMKNISKIPWIARLNALLKFSITIWSKVVQSVHKRVKVGFFRSYSTCFDSLPICSTFRCVCKMGSVCHYAHLCPFLCLLGVHVHRYLGLSLKHGTHSLWICAWLCPFLLPLCHE